MRLVDDPEVMKLYGRLGAAIAQVNDAGHTTPCQDVPAAWDVDDAVEPRLACGTCPVFDVCRSYALTGAVHTGTVGGLSMREYSAQVHRARRRAKALGSVGRVAA